MEDGFLGLPLKVSGTDGVAYTVKPYAATVERVEKLWEEAGRYSFLFSEFTDDLDRERFITYFLSPGVVIFEVFKDGGESVGIMYADQIRPEHSARGHYFFTDKVQKTREPVILAVLLWFMDTFGLNRIGIEIPWYAYSALRRVYAMGIMPEGIKKGAVRFKGNWRDQLTFGIQRKDLNDDVVLRGRLQTGSDAVNWFGLLDNEPDLAKAIFKRD